MSDSLQSLESQHTRPPCPSPAPGVHLNSCPSSWWCHPAISSPVVPLLLLPPISPSFRVFSNQSTLCMRWPKYWSFSFSICPPMNTQDWSPLEWTGWISLQFKGLSGVFSNHSSKASILRCSAFFTVKISHPYMTTGKTIALTRWTFVGKLISLLLNMLSRLVITFLPRSKCLFISWLHSPSAVILEPQNIKSDTVSTVFPSISHEVMGPDLSFLNVEL